jgi:hypothetical protein
VDVVGGIVEQGMRRVPQNYLNLRSFSWCLERGDGAANCWVVESSI